jgi:hypothetical protein
LKRPLVRVDPDLSDLIPGFIARKHEDLATLSTAAAQKDYETVSKMDTN